MPIQCRVLEGVAEIVIDLPPMNALKVKDWFYLAEQITELGRNPKTRALILTAAGRGFNAGVDIKEMQTTPGFRALLNANRSCYAAFKAVYECEVPVVAAVHKYCLGGGMGLVGNADIIIAGAGTEFGLPEVDRGALGATTHLARLVPPHKLRAMVYTATTVTAEELQNYGSVYQVVPEDELMGAAWELAREIAEKSPKVIRAAKQCLNGIDPVDVNRSYRFEQGFTFELNLDGVTDEAYQAFTEGHLGEGGEDDG
ncbi:MAG: enoyl-CoA hydratase [Myxococcales bacterium]|nr:enoyl-CoA hydratase [Myxococcales bacterium]|tara:strand:+ start:680 stop:1447 length:768 start_codon:yes stop_codon:yes gene_type:complete